MGFFKNIFKRKEGGTMVGNLLRGTASSMTGGLLGSGAGLAKWESEQRIDRENDAYAKLLEQSKVQQAAGQNLVNKVAVPLMADGQSTQPMIGENVFWYSVKKQWWKPALALIVVVVATWLIARPKKGNTTFKFRR